MFRYLQDNVKDDFTKKYEFFGFVVESVTELMNRRCDIFKVEVDKIFKKEIEKTKEYNLLSKNKFVPPRKLPLQTSIKKVTLSRGEVFKKTPIIDVIIKVDVGGKIKKISLSKMGGNLKPYLQTSIIENSLYEARVAYREFLIHQVEIINALNEFSLLVNKITSCLGGISNDFLGENFVFPSLKSHHSQLKKLFKSDMNEVCSHLSSEIFLHLKYHTEELFELIRLVKSNFEIETKAIIHRENKKLKAKKNTVGGEKYYPIINPVRIITQYGPMYSLLLPVGEVYLANMFASIRIKSKQKLSSAQSVEDKKLDSTKGNKRTKYASHHIAKFNMSNGKKGVIPEMILYNRFSPVHETLFDVTKEMLLRLDSLNTHKSAVFIQLEELSVIALKLANSTKFKAAI